MMPLTFGAEVLNEYDFAQASCIVRKGDEPLKISWSFHGADITSDTGIIITPLGTKASMLSIASVNHKHRGNYTCTAKNKAGSSRQTVELRVNGNFNLFVFFKVTERHRIPSYSCFQNVSICCKYTCCIPFFQRIFIVHTFH